MFHLSRRLAAGLITGLVLFVPLSAVAVSAPQIAQAAPAVSAPSTWEEPRALALDCETQLRLLAQLGLEEGEAALLWNRFGAELSGVVKEGALSPAWLEALSLPNCREELLDRYAAFLQDNPQLTPEEAVLQVNMGLDRPFYQEPDTLSLSPGEVDTQVLVNKYHALPRDYEPQLVRLEGLGSGSLAPEAARAFADMAAAARDDGITLRSVSAYRSYATQKATYNRNLSLYSQRFTDTFSARPGHSEHQTGLAVDINSASMLDHFENTAAYAWLQENCARYGFLLRYPEGKDAVTGYRFEPWHYRYVGREIATVCMEEGLTLEEYFAAQPSSWGEAPRLLCEGQALSLDSAPLLLGQTWYFPAEEAALALGFTRASDDPSLFTLGERQAALLPGQRSQVNGVTLRFTAPALSLGGQLYLPADDLGSALGLTLEEAPPAAGA